MAGLTGTVAYSAHATALWRRYSSLFALLLMVTLLTVAGTVKAQWSSVSKSDDGVAHTNALAQNRQGASLRFFHNGDNQIIGEFKLGGGLLRLDTVTCPTLQIDQVPPEDLNLAQYQCDVSGDQARFILTRIQDGNVTSPTFLQLMNGRQLDVRYRLQGAGYGQQSFSLKGSKQVLKSTLPQDTVVEGN